MWWLVALLSCVGPFPVEPPEHCGFEHAGPGEQGLALLVGVSKYESPEQKGLKGPREDVAAIRDLLVDHYAFDPRVCMLLDEQATVGAFQSAMKALARQSDPEDQVVIYFAGHGSQLRDTSMEEGDNQDETLTFYDSRNGEVCDVRDDELHVLVADITKGGTSVTVLIDACHSGDSIRGDTPPALGSRYMTPSECGGDGEFDEGGAGSLVQQTLHNVVFLSASTASQDAYEMNGRSLFSKALVDALESPPEDWRLTWGAVQKQVASHVAAQLEGTEKEQEPQLLGRRAWDREVFGLDPGFNTWRVTGTTGDAVLIEGVPGAGWSVGAVARVVADDLPVEERAYPEAANAQIKVVKSNGRRAVAELVDPASSTQIPVDSRVVLEIPGRVHRPLPVALPRTSRSEIEMDPHVRALIDPTSSDPALTVTMSDDSVTVTDQEGIEVVHVDGLETYDVQDELEYVLERFANQHAIRQLSGQGGGVLRNDHSLKVRLVPGIKQDCAAFVWQQKDPGELQEVPLCGTWTVEVIVRDDADVDELSVGGAILWNDGTLTPLPSRTVQRGREVRFQRMEARVPVGALERVVVVGVPVDEKISWKDYDDHLLSTRSPTRDEGELLRVLNALPEDRLVRGPWTTSTARFRTVASPGAPLTPVPEYVGPGQCRPTPTRCERGPALE